MSGLSAGTFFQHLEPLDRSSSILRMVAHLTMRAICVKKFTIAICATVLAVSPLRVAAQDTVMSVVFRLGQFDRSSEEFASGNPTRAVNFVIAQSDPTKDWFAWQPAVLAATLKSAEIPIACAPRSISFSLAGAPAARYRLHLALLIENASVPAMKVTINGKDGKFYLHPRLDYSNGDQGDSFYPAYSSADIDFTFPGSYLRMGANTIALQAIEETTEAVPDAGLVYDAIELDSQPGRVDSQTPALRLDPTVFYREQNSELLEIIEAFLSHSQPFKPGTKAALTIGARTYRADLAGGYEFGEEKAEFQVYEFSSRTPAQLTVELDGRKQRFTQTINPAKKWTLFLVPHIHVDVGYSDYQAKVAAIQARTLDEAMEMTARHSDFRFSLDGEWDLEQFLSTHSAAQQQRAIEAIQKKQLLVPAQYANLLTGLPTAEVLIRSLYPSANFSRIHQTPFDYANITDVPSYSWSYASILAAAGIHTLAGGSNNYRAPVLLQGRLNEKSPMWWTGPDGGKVLLWYSRIYQQMQMLFGLPPVVQAGHETLPLFLQMYSRPNYRADAAMIYGTQEENTDLFPQQEELVEKWNRIYAYPRLRYSSFAEALENIAVQFGKDLPTIRGDGGPYWEDGAASDAAYLAIERRAEARAQTAEKLATLVPFVNPLLKVDAEELGRMWTDMVLMDEHTWDSYNSVGDPTSEEAVDQLKVKEQFAVNAAARVDFIARRAMANLANAIPAGQGSLIVFNSLNWKRSGPVVIDLDKGQEILDLKVDQPVPFEILSVGINFNRVRFIAREVPAVGYKVYRLQPEKKPVIVTGQEQRSILESPFYKVVLDPSTCAIRSIYDKQLQREIVSSESPYRFAEYLYVTGGDKSPNTILQYSHVYPKPELVVHPARNCKIVSVQRTADGDVAHTESESFNTPSIRAEIRLDNREKKIEILEEVDKKEVFSKEAAYFAFPFTAGQPRFQYEVQNGVVDPATDMYPGAGHEWFSMQHWVSVEQDGLSASVLPLDAPLITLGDINRGTWPEEFGRRPGTVFSYVMNNYWDTNYRAGQGGHFSFHYVITSASSTNAQDLSRMGWEEVTPLETDIVTSQDKAVLGSEPDAHAVTVRRPELQPKASCSQGLDDKQQSFVEIDDPNIVLETLKPAEDGNGTILRLLDLGGTERTVSAKIPCLRPERVWQTDAVERGQSPVSIEENGQFDFTVHPNEIVTLRLIGGSK